MERHRGLASVVHTAMKNVPVVVVEGPRAAGKTTLIRSVVGEANVFDLSAADTYEQAEASPRAWVEALPVGAAIDEAQRIPNLTLEIKRQSDLRSGVKGQYLLTGSVRLRRDELGGSDPLVGRVRRCTLLPFAQCELGGGPLDVIASLFDGKPSDWVAPPTQQPEMSEIMIRGGFPLMQEQSDPANRRNSLADYVQDLFSSPVVQTRRDTSAIVGLFRWLSASSGQMQRITEFGKSNELAKDTVTAYLAELQRAFLIRSIPGWHRQLGKRETATPRLFVVDPSFSADAHDLARHQGAATEAHGRIFETFAATELERLASWSSIRTSTYHWREDAQREVDIVLEDELTGRLVAFEIKAARESSPRFFDGIKAFKGRYPEKFHRGFVLHCGDHPLRHADDLWSLPFSALWTIGDRLGPSPRQDSAVSRALRDTEAIVKQERSKKTFRHQELGKLTRQIATVFDEDFFVPLASVAETLNRLNYRSSMGVFGTRDVPGKSPTGSPNSAWGSQWTFTDQHDDKKFLLTGEVQFDAEGATTWTVVCALASREETFREMREVPFVVDDAQSREDLRIELEELVAAFVASIPALLNRLEGWREP